MAKRTRRNFGDMDRQVFLKQIKDFKQVCVLVCAKAPIGGDAYKSASGLIEEITRAGEKLTGNNRFFTDE